jgi:hypothetical protein
MLPVLEAEAAKRQAAALKQNAAKTPVTQKVGERGKHAGEAAAEAAATTGTNRQYVASGSLRLRAVSSMGNGCRGWKASSAGRGRRLNVL